MAPMKNNTYHGQRKPKRTRKIDTSNYIVKSINNSRRVALKNKKSFHMNDHRRHNRNQTKVEGRLLVNFLGHSTYSILPDHEQEPMFENQFENMSMVQRSLPFKKKYSQQNTGGLWNLPK